ncbi:hypothetical protein HYE41_02690 [Mycoplasmopsis bovis]|nr:hypothetical protein [Mycoplasmopsis bovis]QQH20698.1 hypothetical protein HYE41_02690 [Mycoplasmopsis bovis]
MQKFVHTTLTEILMYYDIDLDLLIFETFIREFKVLKKPGYLKMENLKKTDMVIGMGNWLLRERYFDKILGRNVTDSNTFHTIYAWNEQIFYEV